MPFDVKPTEPAQTKPAPTPAPVPEAPITNPCDHCGRQLHGPVIEGTFNGNLDDPKHKPILVRLHASCAKLIAGGWHEATHNYRGPE